VGNYGLDDIPFGVWFRLDQMLRSSYFFYCSQRLTVNILEPRFGRAYCDPLKLL
jgi:hypothetical protein